MGIDDKNYEDKSMKRIYTTSAKLKSKYGLPASTPVEIELEEMTPDYSAPLIMHTTLG